MKTHVQAGGRTANHNETLAHAAGSAGGRVRQGDFLKRTSLVVVHDGVAQTLTSPQREGAARALRSKLSVPIENNYEYVTPS